jgi:hypothetical protein
MICPHCGKSIDDDRKRVYGNGKTQDKKYISMTFRVMNETEKAIAVDWFDEKIWMPKSQIKAEDGGPAGGYNKGETVTIQVSEWIAKEKGFIEAQDEPSPPIPDNAREKAEQRLKELAAKREDIPF